MAGTLFATVIKRARLFDDCAVDATVYKLPSGEEDEREAVAELLADPELRGVASRAWRRRPRFPALTGRPAIRSAPAPRR
jgi:hypothetical protein